MFREIDQRQPTLLLDEVDAKTLATSIRVMLNAGFEKGATVTRTERFMGVWVPRHFTVYCPKVLAGIGDFLPPITASRCIPIRLQRRAPDEKVDKLYLTDVQGQLQQDDVTALLAEFARFADQLADVRPSVPERLGDRQSDIVQPLFAVGEVLGRGWPQRISDAVLDVFPEDDEETLHPVIGLLADIKTVFDDKRKVERLRSAELVEELRKLDEPRYEGKPIRNPRDLARNSKTSRSVRRN